MALKIYCDAADISSIEEYSKDERISGFTTNPSILKKAGITDYKTFAKTVLSIEKNKPVSFEVLSDDFSEMERQANEIQSWGDNVYVKIPITNTKGESSIPLIRKLSGLNLNVTAVMTVDQILQATAVMKRHHILSVFVGRITDTQSMLPIPQDVKTCQWLWASTREVYSVVRAALVKYDIITMTPDLIKKLSLREKDLSEYSLETVKQFYEDGKGLTI